MAEEQGRVFQFEFRDYLKVLRRRKWTVILATLIVVGTGVFLSVRQDKAYRAKAQVLIEPLVTNNRSVVNLRTQVRLLESQAVRERALAKLPSAGSVSGSVSEDGSIITVVSDSRSPTLAARSVDAYTNAFLEYRRERATDRALAASEGIQVKLDDIGKQLEQVSQELTDGRAAISSRYAPVSGESANASRIRQETATRELASLEERLKPRQSTLTAQELVLETAMRDLTLDAQRANQDAEILDPPSVPTEPVRPRPVRDGLLALGAGLILGISLAFLFEYMDDSINNRDDVVRALGGPSPPVIGTIPLSPEWRDASRSELVALTAPRSPAAEAYRALRTSVNFLAVERRLSALAITSPAVGEGKTTTVSNLAVVMAGAGKHVVVVDCDLRRPRVHQFFGLSNEVGFTSVLIGEAPLSRALQEAPGVNRVSVLASGPLPPNPSELLSSRRFGDLLKQLRTDGRVVIIDCPPLLPVTDAAVIAAGVDCLLVVAAAGRSTRKQLRQTVDFLRQIDAPLSGVILNRVDLTEEGGYYYYYDGDDEEDDRPLRPVRRGVSTEDVEKVLDGVGRRQPVVTPATRPTQQEPR